MKPATFLSTLALTVAAAVFSACATTDQGIDYLAPDANRTLLSDSVSDFGELLRAHPMRRPYRFDAPVVLGLVPILNYSGEDGLPPDLSTVLTTIVSQVGEPIRPKPSHSFREMEVGTIAGVYRTGPEADLTIRGSVTEGEKRRTTEFSVDMDLLFEDREDDGRPGRNSVDTGGSYGKGNEVWTLALDLHLVDKSGLVVEAVSHRVDVVRRGRTASYGVFFRGSGLGVRSRKLIAQSKSHALRIAAQQSVMVLLGRHFRVPYWRVLEDGVPDQQLIDAYRRTLRSEESPEDFRLLLFAHGLDINLDSYTFSESERRAAAELRYRLGLPSDLSDVDFAMHLWQTVPFSAEGSRIAALRTLLKSGGSQPSAQRSSLRPDSVISLISGLRDGQELYVPVFFEYNRSTLSEVAKQRIDLLMEALRTSGRLADDWWFDLRGHSDARGERVKLQELSERRAARVQEYLEEKHSVPSQLITSAGFGATEPIEENARSEEEHSQNRRVEILLVAGMRPATVQPSASGRAAEPETETSVSLFPPTQWPLPYGIVLPVHLADSTLSVVRTAYPTGRLSTTFGYYAIRLEEDESPLFSEMTFVFTEKVTDPKVAWVVFSCRNGVQDHLAPAVAQRYPQADARGYLETSMRWTDLDGYDLTVGLDRYCMKIEPTA